MLQSLDGSVITTIPHAAQYRIVVQQLGPSRTQEVRDELVRRVDQMPSNRQRGLRMFNSSYLGSAITPWPFPLAHLYDVARELEGPLADEEEVQEKAGWFFGQFVWASLIQRTECWVVYDPNLSGWDPNRLRIGKTYFEQ